MGTPLKNPPVYLTVVQVRFNPILKLDDYLPSIQDSFRKADYSDYQVQHLVSIQVIMNEGQATPTPIPQDRFLFGNADKTHLFILDNHSLTLQSTDYGHYENFSTCFLNGLSRIHDVLKLAFTERIGLRTLDRVMPEEGEILEQYLFDQVNGHGRQLNGTPVSSYSETLTKLGEFKLVSRITIYEGPLAFPPDLSPANMEVASRFKSYTDKSAILDNDAFVQKREAFSLETVSRRIFDIHKIVGSAFKATVTPYALTSWDK